MAMSERDDDDFMDRAAEAMRQESPTGWSEVSASVLSRVKATTRHTRPVQTTTSDLTGLTDGDRIDVSDLVVISAIRLSLKEIDGMAPQRISLTLVEDHCVGVQVALVAAYGTDLEEVGHETRERTLATLEELLGPRSETVVDVHVDDVIEGDPNA